MPYFEKHVFICNNERPDGHPRGDCTKKGGKEVRARFKSEIAERGLKGRMRANMAGCLDNCEMGCSVVVYPEDVWYGHVTPDDVTEIVEKHLIGGEPVERLVIPRQRREMSRDVGDGSPLPSGGRLPAGSCSRSARDGSVGGRGEGDVEP